VVGFDNAPHGQRHIQKDGVHNAVDYAASAVGNQSGIFSQQIECSDRWRGRERVEAIALKEVPGANESNITEMELDREHGRMIYEIEIQYNNTEHEFDIDATTGEILKKK